MSFRRDAGLLLAQDQVHDPAPLHMLPRLAAMVQNVGVSAARFFQTVGQDGQAIEGPVLVDRLGQFKDAAAAPGHPKGIDGWWRVEGIAEDAAE